MIFEEKTNNSHNVEKIGANEGDDVLKLTEKNLRTI